MVILQPSCLCSLLISLMFILMVSVSAVDPYTEALLSLKSELIDHSNSVRDWILPHTAEMNSSSEVIHACSWQGVKCNANSTSVIGIDISAMNLGGVLSGKQFNLFSDLVDFNISHNSFSEKLPIALFNLSNLRSLDISRNNFSGQFPGGISNLKKLVVLDAFSNSFSGPLPRDVSEIESLEVVNFAGSYFDGPIPSEYGSFKNLKFIHLAGNFLSGELPPDLFNLKTVTHMEIGYNVYEGSIPWQIGNMGEIQYLDIADANLSGLIPLQLSNLTKLESLFLFKNKLNGQIPWELSRLGSLKSLDLSDNLLSGYIPESFSELKNLTLLSLMYNNMIGTVPEGIAWLPNLDSLLLWNNFFSGSLPEDLGRYSNLKYLDLSTNNFTGNIPPNICERGVLQRLILFSNLFTGELFPSLANCSSLVRLRLEDNSLTGEISLDFSNLPDLTYVDLSRNKLVGGIPSYIAQASGLQYFNVSNNQELGGMIPKNIWSLPNMQNFSASSCKISGDIPSFENCKYFTVIELKKNDLSGILKESVSNCHALLQMDLSWNNLTGSIPEELAALPVISVLDLSHNMFRGPLPKQFGNSSSLKQFNVSFNDISGNIPQGNTFRVMDGSAFLGNPKLCGAPLRHCQSLMPNELEIGSRRTQKLAWVLIACAVTVLFVTFTIFAIVYLKRSANGEWKMVPFGELPQLTSTDVLRSLNSIESMEMVQSPSGSAACKTVLPTGLTVSIKKIEWETKHMRGMLQYLSRMGDARHKNLTRLLGLCYNRHLVYLLYDSFGNGNLSERIGEKRDWSAKYKIIIGIAKGLCFLHHDCVPAIPHGDLKSCNILFDENMEPRLAEYGLGALFQLKKEGLATTIKEQLQMDIYNFGELILQILTNGRLNIAEAASQNSRRESLVRETLIENDITCSGLLQSEIEQVLEVAFLCIRSTPENKSSMEEILKLLSRLQKQKKHQTLK
ncbi:hypothetical protein Leryth_006628 [Lithospermum erythrorhizon]|nr:hypothetical protein Leryth_006628 [Lithospermum erythrorhizon]